MSHEQYFILLVVLSYGARVLFHKETHIENTRGKHTGKTMHTTSLYEANMESEYKETVGKKCEEKEEDEKPSSAIPRIEVHEDNFSECFICTTILSKLKPHMSCRHGHVLCVLCYKALQKSSWAKAFDCVVCGYEVEYKDEEEEKSNAKDDNAEPSSVMLPIEVPEDHFFECVSCSALLSKFKPQLCCDKEHAICVGCYHRYQELHCQKAFCCPMCGYHKPYLLYAALTF